LSALQTKITSIITGFNLIIDYTIEPLAPLDLQKYRIIAFNDVNDDGKGGGWGD